MEECSWVAGWKRSHCSSFAEANRRPKIKPSTSEESPSLAMKFCNSA